MQSACVRLIFSCQVFYGNNGKLLGLNLEVLFSYKCCNVIHNDVFA